MLPPPEGEEVHPLLNALPFTVWPMLARWWWEEVPNSPVGKLRHGGGGRNIRDLGSTVMSSLIAVRFGGCKSCYGHPTRTHIPPHPSGSAPGGCLGVAGEMVRPHWGSVAAARGDTDGAGSVIQPGLQSEQQLTVLGCNCHRQVTAVSPRQLFGASVLRAGQVPAAGTAG